MQICTRAHFIISFVFWWLNVDNVQITVLLMLFTHLVTIRIPDRLEHSLLVWGLVASADLEQRNEEEEKVQFLHLANHSGGRMGWLQNKKESKIPRFGGWWSVTEIAFKSYLQINFSMNEINWNQVNHKMKMDTGEYLKSTRNNLKTKKRQKF